MDYFYVLFLSDCRIQHSGSKPSTRINNNIMPPLSRVFEIAIIMCLWNWKRRPFQGQNLASTLPFSSRPIYFGFPFSREPFDLDFSFSITCDLTCKGWHFLANQDLCWEIAEQLLNSVILCFYQTPSSVHL